MTSPGPRGRRGDHPLGDAFDAYLRSQGHGALLQLARLVAVWPDVVGPDVAAHASPRSLRDGTLVVAVDQPAWATQLAFLAETVLDGLAAALGERLVTDLQATVQRNQALE